MILDRLRQAARRREGVAARVDQEAAEDGNDHLPGSLRAVNEAGTTVLDGERAAMVALRCPRGYGYPKSVAVKVMTLHAGFGYFAMCFSEEFEDGSIPQLTNDCERWLSSFRFTD